MIDLLQTNKLRPAAAGFRGGGRWTERQDRAVLCTTCASPRYWQTIHMWFSLSKHNFPAFTLRDLSLDEAAEPSVPSQLLKLIFCAAGLDLHRSYDALGGKKGNFPEEREQNAFFARPHLLKITSHAINLLQRMHWSWKWGQIMSCSELL